MKQQSLASQAVFEKYGRKSRRELFLEEMEGVVPWLAPESLVRPHCRIPGWKRRCTNLPRCAGSWAWISALLRRILRLAPAFFHPHVPSGAPFLSV